MAASFRELNGRGEQLCSDQSFGARRTPGSFTVWLQDRQHMPQPFGQRIIDLASACRPPTFPEQRHPLLSQHNKKVAEPGLLEARCRCQAEPPRKNQGISCLQSCLLCDACNARGVVPDLEAVVFDVKGMRCGGCSAAVKRILLTCPEIQSASVNLLTESAVLRLPAKVAQAGSPVVQQAAELLTSKVRPSYLDDRALKGLSVLCRLLDQSELLLYCCSIL